MHHLCTGPEGLPYFYDIPVHVKPRVRFFASRRIKQHAPLLVRAPVNSFEF